MSLQTCFTFSCGTQMKIFWQMFMEIVRVVLDPINFHCKSGWNIQNILIRVPKMKNSLQRHERE